MEANPFKEGLVTEKSAAPCTIVIFGATGDLTHRKLIPALYNLAVDGDLPPGTRVIGFARREKTDEQFRAELEAINKEVSRQSHDPEIWDQFARLIHYHQSEFQDLEGYRALAKRLQEIRTEQGTSNNTLYYLASAPEFFDDILLNAKKSGLNSAPDGAWSRVIVEKPFGTDLATARHLNQVVNDTFKESDTYRIDHYLGKETAQNIMVLRFANAIFEPLWNSNHIDHIQVTCAEHLGMEGGRGGYYDTAGALRDMVQNHLLQLLSLVAMEPPVDLSADGVRDEKVKVLKSLRRMPTPEDVAKSVVRAQYTAGSINGETVPGYREEDRIAPDSQTEAYVALRIMIDTWRWEGVPFYVRMGKRLPKKATEISVHFKDPPNVLFSSMPVTARKNVLVIRIQPDEGISLRMLSKLPGPALNIEPVKMDFHYRSSFGKSSPEAYERLLLDAMAGDATLFARRDEVESAWAFIDDIEHAWHQSKSPPPLAEYPAGSWGPEEADQLLKQNNHLWRRL
ncbi:MAG: glucose-6-phosphate dehydrogenase [Verrucomicrobiota bacterium]